MRILIIIALMFCFGRSDANFSYVTDEIVQAGKFLNQAGLCPATSGNISTRVDLVAITASGKHKGELTPDDVLLVNLDGVVQHSNKKPSAETALHTMIYRLYKDAGAVLHTHTLNGTVLSLHVAPDTEIVTNGFELHKAFPGITTHESQFHIPIFENSQNMNVLVDEIEDYLYEHPDTYGFLLRGHGLYTWGKDMKEAKTRVEAFEYLFEAELKLRELANSSEKMEGKKYESVSAILTDVEGTTTSISFVKDILFPYAKAHVREYVHAHEQEEAVSKLLAEVREIGAAPNATTDEVVDIMLAWMEQDKKITPLKTLQGMMWEEGYERGDFHAHIYPDAFEQIKQWKKKQGKILYVYSSGSVQAQQLLFGHSDFGDLTPYFTGYFDTMVGGKRETASYTNIAKQMNLDPGSVLFLSDTIEELDAARAAGMQTVLLCRDGAPPANCPYDYVTSFNQIEIR